MGTGERRARGRHLVVVAPAIAGAAFWAGSAGGQTVVASEVLQLSSTDEAPEDGALHVGPVNVASAGGPRYRVLLRFDLPPLDAESLPEADLVLKDAPCYYDDEPSVSAYPIVSQWGPDTVWSTQPEVGEPVATDQSATCPTGHVRFDVTALVREWLTGGVPVLGIELRGDESVQDPRTYATSEGETDRLDRRFDPDVEAAIVLAAPQQSPPDSPLVPILVSGTLADELGEPVAGGTVTVYRALDTEDTVAAPQLASATTDASGGFVVRVAADDELAASAAANDGWVNFEASFKSGSRVQFRSFSQRLDGARWAPGSPIRVQLDSMASVLARTAARATVEAEPDLNPRMACFVSTTKIADADRWTVIGEAHAWKDQSLTWTYGARADSDIGVGYSADGVHWSVSGSVHIGTERSARIADTVSHLGEEQANFGRRYRTEFHYAKYRSRQYCPGHTTTTYRIKATRWNGGFDYYDDVKHLNGHCGDTYRANNVYFEPADGLGTFGRSSEDFRTYGLAVSVFGASLSAQSGASTRVTQKWRFGRLFSRYYLCGDTGKPSVSERVFAGF